MPSAVSKVVGRTPIVVELHGSLLGLFSQGEITQLVALEGALAHDPHVAAEYGPISWIRGRLAAVTAQLASQVAGGAPRADVMIRDGLTDPLALSNSDLIVGQVMGDGSAPMSSVRWLFPDATDARLLVRPAHGASMATVRAVVRRLLGSSGLYNEGVTLGGAS